MLKVKTDTKTITITIATNTIYLQYIIKMNLKAQPTHSFMTFWTMTPFSWFRLQLCGGCRWCSMEKQKLSILFALNYWCSDKNGKNNNNNNNNNLFIPSFVLVSNTNRYFCFKNLKLSDFIFLRHSIHINHANLNTNNSQPWITKTITTTTKTF